MNPMSHKARVSGQYKFLLNGKAYVVARDDHGRTGFTALHEKGHLATAACMVNVLGYAALHRHLPEHHAIYMAKARSLRTKGTWL